MTTRMASGGHPSLEGQAPRVWERQAVRERGAATVQPPIPITKLERVVGLQKGMATRGEGWERDVVDVSGQTRSASSA
jgi:hypothetical protein